MALDINSSFLTDKAIDYALLSNLAYADWSNGVPSDNNDNWNTLYKKGYRFIAQYTDPQTGYSGVIFQDSSGKEILTNRGTEITDLNDLSADMEIAATLTPGEQFKSMVDFIQAFNLSAGQFDVTGHSLGGALSQMAKAAYDNSINEVYTFNAPGAKNLSKSYSFVRNSTNAGYVIVQHPVLKYLGGIYVTIAWKETEWSQEAWNRYLNMQTSVDGSRGYNVSGKDSISRIANLGTDIGMEIFVNGWDHGITSMTGDIKTAVYYTDPQKPVTIIGSKANEVIKGNYNSGHYTGVVQKETLIGGYGNDVIYAGDGGSEIYGDLPQNIIDDPNALKKSGNDTGMAGDDVLTGGIGSDAIYGGGGNDRIFGLKGDDTLYGGTGYDTYIYVSGDGKDIISDEDNNGRIIVQNAGFPYGTIYVGNLYQNEGNTTWEDAANGFQFNGSKITLSDGGSIEVQNFNPGDFGINLITVPDNPIATNTILGDLKPVDFDPDQEGIQTQNDQWGNVITDPGQPEPGRVDGIYDTTGNDRIKAGDGNDGIVSSHGGNDWLLGGGGDDNVIVDNYQTIFGNDILEGNAGSDIVEGGKGNDKVFGDDYGGMTDLIAAGETAIGINERGDVASGGEGDNYVYGSIRNDALFGGTGKDLLAGGGGDDVIIGDDNYMGAVHDWSYSITTTPSGDTNIYGLSFSGLYGGLDATGAIGDDDVIYGGTGNDYIDGVGGGDEIYGGAGNDVLNGGLGHDVYEYDSDGNDQIIDEDKDGELIVHKNGSDVKIIALGNFYKSRSGEWKISTTVI